MARQVVVERVYPYPPELVWQALTDPQALSEWLMETDFQPQVGHHFTFRTKAAPGFDGIVRCEVLAVEEPRRLVYTWQGGPMKKPTTVTWTLDAMPEGTRVRVEQSGFEGLAGVPVSWILGSGWRGLLNKQLPAMLEKLKEAA